MEGSSFTFTVSMEFNGNVFAQTYTGTVDGDTMSGEVQGGRGGAGPFTGKRVK